MDEIDEFHQRRGLLVQVIVLLSALLIIVAFGVVLGPGLDPASWQIVWVPVAALTLGVVVAGFGWMLWRRPVVLRIGAEGVELPIVFKAPMPWSDMHRIRYMKGGKGLYGVRDWIIIDPSPGVLPPLRLPVWRRFELKFQKHFGVRIPLHGIDADPQVVIASIERFRPVTHDS